MCVCVCVFGLRQFEVPPLFGGFEGKPKGNPKPIGVPQRKTQPGSPLVVWIGGLGNF